jgi:predicted nucleic acid-binding protein
MSAVPGLVLDANILLRGVFGTRVRLLLEKYEENVNFYTPDVCFEEARAYIPDVAKRKGTDASIGLAVLDELGRLITIVDKSLYQDCEASARERVGRRDPDDWPLVALSLTLGLEVWTEDQDFFGIGIPVWTTAHVETFLRNAAKPSGSSD